MLPSPSNFAARTWAWLLPAAVTLATYLVLFWLVPYSEGYLGGRQPVLQTAYSFWTGYEDWQHGMVVPFLVAGIIWMQRKELASVPIRGANSGLAIIVVTLFVYWLGFKIDHHYIGFISAQLLIAGLIVWFLGWSMMKALFFPWAFLVFTWPFLFLDSLIAFPLRMFLADLAFHFLNGLGLSCVKVGSAVVSAPDPLIQLASGKRFAIDIADPCSGIRSLFALMMVSALYAYFAVPGIWRKLVLFAGAIPFAILGNFVRILILVFGTMMFGADFAIGSLEKPTAFHLFAGFFVFVVALAAMVLLGTILTWDWQKLPQFFRRYRAAATDSVASPRNQPEPQPDLY